MKNWKKLRILIVLFQICGNKTLGSAKSAYFKEESVNLSCKERIAPYIINPYNKYKVMWDLAQGLIYLMSFLLDPIVFAFKFKPLENRQLNRFS